MRFEISILKPEKIEEFWPVFAEVLQNEFPGYSQKVIDYFLEKIYNKQAFSYWITKGLKTVLVAKTKTQLVGFALIDQPYGGVSFCRWLGVKKTFQKKGVGRQLINSWITFATSHGCHKVEVASQPAAEGFYKKVGLRLEGQRKLSYFGVDQFIFGKVIDVPNDQIMTRY